MLVSAYFADGTNGVSARYHRRLRRNHLQVVTVDVRARSKIVRLSSALSHYPHLRHVALEISRCSLVLKVC